MGEKRIQACAKASGAIFAAALAKWFIGVHIGKKAPEAEKIGLFCTWWCENTCIVGFHDL
jgi:hypothetical protein